MQYTIRKSTRAKRARITIDPHGRVIVVAPQKMNEKVIAQFIDQQKGWIEKNLLLLKQRKKRYLDSSPEGFIEHKKKAYAIIKERVDYFCAVYDCSYNTISIKNQKTRWGSCSKQKNLYFRYSIIFLPDALRDYVIIHEVCHLRELNHSPRFWTLVAKTIPDYKKLQKELQSYIH